jgi:chromosome segregation ATPase
MIRVTEAIENISAVANISPATFYNYLKKYRIESVKQGKYKYLHDEDYKRLLAILSGEETEETAFDEEIDSQVKIMRQLIDKKDMDIEYFRKLIEEKNANFKTELETVENKYKKDLEYFRDELRHKDDTYMELLRAKDKQIGDLDGKIQNFQVMLASKQEKILQLQEDTTIKESELQQLREQNIELQTKLEALNNKGLLNKIKKLFNK